MARQARTRFAALMLIGILVLVGCRQPAPPSAGDAGLQIGLTLEPDPPVTGAATLRVSVRNGGQPVDDAKLNVRGDMTHAGMIPVIRDIDESADGVYVVPFEWTMSGDWIVDMTVTLADGQTVQQRAEVTVAPGENEPENHDDHADHEETEAAHDG